MKLTRSGEDVVVAGVLAGLGDYFKIDPTLLRIGAAILIFFSPFPVIPLYVIGAVIIPKAPKNKEKHSRRSTRESRNKKHSMNRERDFEEMTDDQENPSSRATDIEEEDWSDF